MKFQLNPQIKAVNKNLLEKYSFLILLFAVVLSVTGITVVTLMYSTKQVTKGYVINSLEKENQILIRELEGLNMKLNDQRSLKHIVSSQKISGMINPSSIAYIKAENSIARR